MWDVYVKKKDELVDFKFCKLLRLDFLQMGQVRLCCVVCVSCTGFLLVQLQPQALGVSWVICTLEIKLWSNIYHALSAFRCPFLFHLIPTATFWSRYYTSDILLRIREVSFQKQDLNPILWNSEVQAVVVTKCNCAHRTPDTWTRGRLTYSLHLLPRCRGAIALAHRTAHRCRMGQQAESLPPHPPSIIIIYKSSNFLVRLRHRIADFSIFEKHDSFSKPSYIFKTWSSWPFSVLTLTCLFLTW